MSRHRKSRWLPMRAVDRPLFVDADRGFPYHPAPPIGEIRKMEQFDIGIDFGLPGSRCVVMMFRHNPDGSKTAVAEKIVDMSDREPLGYDCDRNPVYKGDKFNALKSGGIHVAEGVSAAGCFVTSASCGYSWENIRKVVDEPKQSQDTEEMSLREIIDTMLNQWERGNSLGPDGFCANALQEYMKTHHLPSREVVNGIGMMTCPICGAGGTCDVCRDNRRRREHGR